VFKTERRIVGNLAASRFAESGILEQADLGFVGFEIVELLAQLGEA
jgi:hypothetical protein